MIYALELIRYLVPTLLIAAILYYYLDKILKTLEKITDNSSTKNSELNVFKLQAYERMAIFLERIKPTQLARRLEVLENPRLYEYSLIKTIQDEYEHNVSQQIYIHPDTWQLIFSTKNATQNYIKECKDKLGIDFTSEELRDEIISQSIQQKLPSNDVLLKLQQDIEQLNQ